MGEVPGDLCGAVGGEERLHLCVCGVWRGVRCGRCGRTATTGSMIELLAVSRTGVLARTSVSSSRLER